MSGIVGAWFRDGRPATPALLGRMLGVLAHRGPDGSTIWLEGPVGFGHCARHTTPESIYEVLPAYDPALDLAITADARIDNRDELIARLGVPTRTGRVPPDSELILAAYREWGAECVGRLLGDFAFAIWDGRSQRLFCARDHFGVRPFLYHMSANALLFGSELKSLLQVQAVPRRLNEARLADYLAGEHLDREYTFFRDVQRLPAGHYMQVDRERRVVQQYWEPDRSREMSLGSDAAYAEAFLDIFKEAVGCRLRGAGNVSAMLSGGLDSSSIVCVARELLRGTGGPPLSTYSAVFEQVEQCDESSHIRAVLNGGGCSAALIPFDYTQQWPISGMREVMQHVDEPAFAPNAMQPWRLFREVRSNGGAVVLDGHGGDETVSHGYGYIRELAHARRWGILLRELRATARSEDESIWLLLAHYLLVALQPLAAGSRVARRAWKGGAAVVNRLATHSAASAEGQGELIDPAFAKRTDLAGRRQTTRAGTAGARSEREDHWRAITATSKAASFEALDAKAGAFSLELRFPFWDRRVVEFCLALPAEQKRSNGWGRLILRRAMDGILPPVVQWRRDKTDFFPFVMAAVRHGEHAEVQRISSTLRPLEGYVDPGPVRAACLRMLGGESTVQDYFMVWRVATLLYWFESGSGRYLAGDLR
jgi:asparagine synthase (glutamine-hydrolysing)